MGVAYWEVGKGINQLRPCRFIHCFSLAGTFREYGTVQCLPGVSVAGCKGPHHPQDTGAPRTETEKIHQVPPL